MAGKQNEVADDVVEQDVEEKETESEAPDREVESADEETETSGEGDKSGAEQPGKKGNDGTKGILRDLQEERERRRKAEELAERTAREISELREQFNAKIAQDDKPEPAEDLKLDDDDLTTFGAVKKLTEKIIREKVEPMAKKIAAYEQEIFANKILNSEKAAKDKYSVAAVGSDLAYDKVFEEGTREMVKMNPGFVEAIRNSSNPAETAYEIGLLHPKFKNTLRKSQSEEVIEKINNPKAVTGRTGAGKSGGINHKTATVQDLIKLTDEELDRLARES